MPIKIIDDSHTDHHLTSAQIKWAVGRFADRTDFFIETVEMPADLGTLPNALIEIDEDDTVEMRHRGGREYPSRIALGRTAMPTRLLTVIAGPHGEEPMVLYTAFGGPNAPKEPTDPTLKPEERAASEAFWSRHALAELA